MENPTSKADGTTPDPGDRLPFDGERFVPGVGAGIAYEHLLRYALAAEVTVGRDVLDVASGEGYGAAQLAAGARSVVGFDASAAAVAHARRRYVCENLRFEQGSTRDFFGRCGDACFDAVTAFEVIEHVTMEDQAHLLESIRRVLRPDGFALLSTPDKLQYSDRPLNANPFHVREYYRDEFREELQRYFSHVALLDQAQLTGCAILPRGARSARLAEMHWTNLVTNEGVCRPEVSTDGEYLVAVVANGAPPETPPVVLVDFSRKTMSETLRVYREEVERLTAALHQTRKAWEDATQEAAALRRELAEEKPRRR